jgi:hypothetical protein
MVERFPMSDEKRALEPGNSCWGAVCSPNYVGVSGNSVDEPSEAA